eukprot:gnl/MRDRNA2_/MRDRNA2_123107_c0_seq1.p1 gnl/MRDRNA2_/MRDRNA2_123107_c0~~gnl/MRDRNA2_/MRDRNA2_123107_c0_seq1.p1  ORF type:complete len:239 (-),score=56.37 gnl/MRDRNA2_/MRDRNA2_123107_c0_seq1:41-757(-)
MEDQRLSECVERVGKRLQVSKIEPERDVEVTNDAKEARLQLQAPILQKEKAMLRERASLESLKEDLAYFERILQDQTKLEERALDQIKSQQKRDEAVHKRKQVACAQKDEFEKVSGDALEQLRCKESQMLGATESHTNSEIRQHLQMLTEAFGLSLSCAGRGAIRFMFRLVGGDGLLFECAFTLKIDESSLSAYDLVDCEPYVPQSSAFLVDLNKNPTTGLPLFICKMRKAFKEGWRN